jgi:hypothetical protein
MLDISEPLRPAAVWRWFSCRRVCEERIERYFGPNSLVIAVLGQELIKHKMLLTICTNRRWGIIPHLYDYHEDETREERREKRRLIRKKQARESSRR